MAIDLSGLNSDQRLAVLHNEGPALVLAGAGSGKTRCLTLRTARLIEERIARPSELLVCTFTRKAAGELKDRLATMLGERLLEDLAVGTFHSVCLTILRAELKDLKPKYRFFEILAEPLPLAKRILAKQDGYNQYPAGMDWDIEPKAVISLVSKLKNACIEHGNGAAVEKWILDNTGLERWQVSRFQQYYSRYEACKERGLTSKGVPQLDYDDLLLWTWRILRDNKDVLARYQARWRFVLVDELQDNNLLQHEITTMLCAGHKNFYGVGDVSQSIYAFRGARPDATILSFLTNYPNGRIIKLAKNYRSTSTIIGLGNSLIQHNDLDEQYRLLMGPVKDRGVPACVLTSDDADHEASQILECIEEQRKFGAEWGDYACLYRTNAQSRALEDAFLRSKTPYVIYGTTSFYGRREIKDLLAYVQIVADPNGYEGEEAVKRVFNIPSKWFAKQTHFFGKAFITEIEAEARRRGSSFYEALMNGYWKPYQRSGVDDFVDLVQRLKECLTPAEVIRQARALAYDDWLRREEGITAEDEADNSRLENLNELVIAAYRFKTCSEMLDFVRQQQATAKQEIKDAVQCMTIHRSKGLEFPVVFVYGCSDGLLPHKRAESIEEERRLCYVAVTRAMEQVYLSYLREWQGKDLEISPFVSEMGLRPEVVLPEQAEALAS